MKNNQGFGLIGVLAIAGALAAMTAGGVAYISYQAKRQAAADTAIKGNTLKANVGNVNDTEAIKHTGDLQFDEMGTPTPTIAPSQSALSPNEERLNGEEVGGGLGFSSSSSGGSTGGNCTYPCHYDAASSGCILSDADCCQFGYCPATPLGCTHVPSGPAGPYVTNDAPNYCLTGGGKSHTPPTSPTPCNLAGTGGLRCNPGYYPSSITCNCELSPTCTAPYVLNDEGSNCQCPGGVTDCVGWVSGGSTSGGSATSVMQKKAIKAPMMSE